MHYGIFTVFYQALFIPTAPMSPIKIVTHANMDSTLLLEIVCLGIFGA